MINSSINTWVSYSKGDEHDIRMLDYKITQKVLILPEKAKILLVDALRIACLSLCMCRHGVLQVLH